MSKEQYKIERPFCAYSEGHLWIETSIEDENRIVQEVVHKLDGMSRPIIRNVLNLQDVGLRQALMKLGWTPPQEPK